MYVHNKIIFSNKNNKTVHQKYKKKFYEFEE